MPIVPSGKKRIMESQSSLDIGDEWGVRELDQSNGYPAVENNNVYTDIDEGIDKTPTETPDLNEYIFKLLEGFGYPPRRLEEFSDNFIEEEFFPGGVKDVTVTLPDRYYGTRKRLSDQDLSRILEDMQSKFNLVLNKASRKDKKIIAEFASHPQEEEGNRGTEEGQENVAGDDLDEIFGPGKEKAQKENGKTDRKKVRRASTMHEMLKENRSNLINKFIETIDRLKIDDKESGRILQDQLEAKIMGAFLNPKSQEIA